LTIYVIDPKNSPQFEEKMLIQKYSVYCSIFIFLLLAACTRSDELRSEKAKKPPEGSTFAATDNSQSFSQKLYNFNLKYDCMLVAHEQPQDKQCVSQPYPILKEQILALNNLITEQPSTLAAWTKISRHLAEDLNRIELWLEKNKARRQELRQIKEPNLLANSPHERASFQTHFRTTIQKINSSTSELRALAEQQAFDSTAPYPGIRPSKEEQQNRIRLEKENSELIQFFNKQLQNNYNRSFA
jgi:hypothetical protein